MKTTPTLTVFTLLRILFHLGFFLFHNVPFWGISFRFKKENPFLIAFHLNHDIKSCNKLINFNYFLKFYEQITSRNIFKK